MAKLTTGERLDILSLAVRAQGVAPIRNGDAETKHATSVVDAANKFERYVSGEKLPRVSEVDVEKIQVEYEHFRELVLGGEVPVDENGKKLMNWLDKLLGA